MLQRIQTLYLLLALAAVTGSRLFDWVTYTQNGVATTFMGSSNVLILYVLIALAGATILITIFRFKDRKSQMLFAKISLFDAFLILIGFGYAHNENIQQIKAAGELEMNYDFGMAMPLLAMILILLAHRAIKQDDDLVKSVDRLR